MQQRLFEILWDDELFDVKSLETSILFNGFLKHERLIVARYDESKFLVLEGNRRLTAVRHLLKEFGNRMDELKPSVRQSLITLPCFVLDGPPIGDSDGYLNDYRRAAEIYIGMRHLMEAKRWEPASRYEFQAKLFNEGWTTNDVAQRFGRKPMAVVRDLKAQKLYQDFRKYEERLGRRHSLTYNAFAEAARAPAIMKWLGWSDKSMRVSNSEREEIFFSYLTTRIRIASSTNAIDEDYTPNQSAEDAVRKLREMLKLQDSVVLEALEDKDFETAELLFEERKEGSFARRIGSYTKGLRRVTTAELGDNPDENKARLDDLIAQAQKTIRLIDALL